MFNWFGAEIRYRWVVGWLDNARFLVDNYQVSAVPPGNTVYLGNILSSSPGSALGTPALPAAPDFRVISADAVYSPVMNTIYSITTSAPIWMSGNSSTGIGDASGSQVVFTSGTRVLAQPH